MTNYLTTIEGRLKQHEQELQNDSNIDNKMVATLLREYEQKAYTDMSHWDVCQLARHPDRPHTRDIIHNICDTFIALNGNRNHSDDPSLHGGLALIGDTQCVILGQDKGRSLHEKKARQFGMTTPHGFRKALRLAKIAERFRLPLITLIDTPGALPTVDAELANQSEAIATNIFEFCRLKTPIISIVVGEAMSGGALAIGVCDHMAMMQHSIFSVISPEGCASILWKDASFAADAAKAMQISAEELLKHKLIDAIIPEPKYGAHKNPKQVYESIKEHITHQLNVLVSNNYEEQPEKRSKKYAQMGCATSKS